MRNAIYIFLLFVLVFFLNLLLYIYVDSYREFIKAIKYGDNDISYENSIDDSYNVNSIEYSQRNTEKSDFEKGLLLDLGITDEGQASQKSTEKNIDLLEEKGAEKQGALGESRSINTLEIQEESTLKSIGRSAGLTNVARGMIEKFQNSGYDILEKTDKDDLLDIASEYPDEYIQYGNENFDLYILSTRKYSEVLDIFNVLEYDMPFTLNRLNNFGDKSFFINLDRTDNKVRFIFEYKNEVYGVKVRVANYNELKSIINTL